MRIRQTFGGRSGTETVKPLAVLILFFSVLRTFFAIPGVFFFWKEVTDKFVQPRRKLGSAAELEQMKSLKTKTRKTLSNGNGVLVQSNDNWRSDQEAEIIATTIPPTDDLESAIVDTVASGNYTAIVRGVNGTTGVALVEAYGLQ